jgi:hypothetical protein
LRRQTAAGLGLLAGSSRSARLDPRSLPVRFSAEDAVADGRTRTIEIDRERVLLSRTVSGVYMRLNLPLAAFLGVAVRLVPASERGEDAIAIVLEHSDSNLSVPLYVAAETDHVIADWQLWGRELGKKLLVAEPDGSLREPFETLGVLMLGRVAPRRLRRTALRTRRPKSSRRHAHTRAMRDMEVHRGEREIIAPE